jgi:molecular chaperone Hsp33
MAHDYPPMVAHLLGQVAALTALLGSIMKIDGTFTVQARAKGPVSLLVADFRSPDELRAYAEFDAEKVATLPDDAPIRELIGDGYLAITIDPADPGMERYQGIVELEGDSLADCAAAYFASSEQTPSELRLASARDPVSGNWRAGGIMIQYLGRPEQGRARISDEERQDAWSRASILLDSIKEEELLDPALTLPQLLYRLYHEDGVRIFDPIKVKRGCRCSDGKIESMLESFSHEDRTEMADGGVITVTCAFCNKDFSVQAA